MTTEESQDFLSEVAREEIRRIGKADILVGIPSHNDAGTIAHVGRTVAMGLSSCFPQARSVIVNADGGSKDGTPRVFEQALVDLAREPAGEQVASRVEKILTPYPGLPGKERAFRQIFGIAEELGVTACAVFDPAVRSVAPQWVEKLIRPVVEGGFEYVTPLYRRHKYDGTITNSIVYPLLQALYGRRVQQPVGGEFGLSGNLVRRCLSKDLWEGEAPRFRIDVWMTTTAVAEAYRVCQTYLGARVQDPKEPALDLATMLVEVVGSVFGLMEEYQTTWQQAGTGDAVPIFGAGNSFSLEAIQVNGERMVQALRQGLRDLLPVWEIILPPETLSRLLPLGLMDLEEFRFPDDLWVQVVYDFALAYHEQVLHREHLLKSLTPLYLGRTASFILETGSSTTEKVEEIIERLCSQYGVMKPYLVERWR